MKNTLEKQFEKLKNDNDDFYFSTGTKNILISAPHAVTQTRDNMIKLAEPETALISLYFNSKNYPCIIKTKNNNDDANRDIDCPYKDKLLESFTSKKTKFLVDLHQLSTKREMDFCLGIGGENYNNLLSYSYMAEKIKNIFKEDGFIAEINNPFGAGKPHTNAGYIARHGFPSIQLEINSRLVFNVSEKEFFKVLSAIEKILKYIEKEIN